LPRGMIRASQKSESHHTAERYSAPDRAAGNGIYRCGDRRLEIISRDRVSPQRLAQSCRASHQEQRGRTPSRYRPPQPKTLFKKRCKKISH
jgi:hypothetical protein